MFDLVKAAGQRARSLEKQAAGTPGGHLMPHVPVLGVRSNFSTEQLPPGNFMTSLVSASVFRRGPPIWTLKCGACRTLHLRRIGVG